MRSFITLDANAVVPAYGTPGAAGVDISASEAAIVPARGRALIHTGLSISLPCEVEMQIRGRSGLALKNGITAFPGTVDEDYRGEVGVVLFNSTDEDFEVKVGDRIAQAVFNRIIPMEFDICESLDVTIRGAAGFGSTGV